MEATMEGLILLAGNYPIAIDQYGMSLSVSCQWVKQSGGKCSGRWFVLLVLLSGELQHTIRAQNKYALGLGNKVS